eukprot:COSAG04_NODE_11414_length_710_cov_1.288052_2_plen_94_part_01
MQTLAAALAAVDTDATVETMLSSVKLNKYVATFSAEGYEYISDLMDADAEDVDGLVAAAGMKKPEEKRFRKVLASMSGGGGGGGGAGGGQQDGQ